MYVIHLYY